MNLSTYVYGTLTSWRSDFWRRTTTPTPPKSNRSRNLMTTWSSFTKRLVPRSAQKMTIDSFRWHPIVCPLLVRTLWKLQTAPPLREVTFTGPTREFSYTPWPCSSSCWCTKEWRTTTAISCRPIIVQNLPLKLVLGAKATAAYPSWEN